ncbi:small ribosomal subunit protein uS5c [Spinacia oleracea]|uniref:Small ribosomal subunit protein uS5c n=4 Tax=Spinacia oleracea TaxID=3562 RepID=RR5_SPIOL|nr:small ribosomal subunit protein uS5c [Spinacia oleracea]Q9ST69.1 RecName: Full=Small ribosomal subunit protein uS5c; AltName: Full=30S ribosomal protein S5, chloroplastic; Flags: Precursor [Spinacia oleracea]4V61_AE Chain AE, Ribosomal Protein S5 [Spinacia oleracea]5MMJ_e Chain e, 30S ribosomal protein S5, chloroplastic [Spinacia oleracea]5MMM_e Chain e, 30S ribosomal protein S5, chloroplastic [Spinacia oleracea]CAA63650.1 ribosomal protein S5 [Spinacia oleracea]
MATTATTTPSATSLTTLHRRIPLFPTTTTLLSLSSSSKPLFLSLSSTRSFPTHLYCIKKDDIDITFFEQDNPDEEITFDPPEKPEGYIPPRAVDEPPFESEEEIALAYEELYGAAYSGESLLGNDVYAMDSKIKKATGFGSKSKKEKIRDGFEENVVQVRRVTKVVKGGKHMRFRAIVVVGDKKGQVGVGVGKAKEVVSAVQKAAVDARRNIITVPMTKYLTFPHRNEADYGAARVMLRPAAPGTGVIAGGAVRTVLEMAGVENALGKQLGSNNALNNARATIVAVQTMRQFSDVARDRGIPMEELWK